ncbi:MAG: pilus assembly protein [Acetobacteraceae bacterium]|nr:pilus assembly protein [Acetobacteraceae bacterium]
MKIFRHLANDTTGAILIEMALIGPPFFLLLAIILDLGLMLANQSLLDGAARDAARLIRTGQVQSATTPISTFQTTLCANMSSVMTTAQCETDIIFEVQVFSSFGTVSFTPCTLNNNQTGSGTVCSFTPGNGGDIVGVQATYNRPFIIPWVGACLSGGSCWAGLGTTSGSNPGTGTVRLMSTVIFRNEPFLS